MNKKQILIRDRREYLVAQAAEQRKTMKQSIDPWRKPFGRIDQGVEALRYVQCHPALVVGAGLLVVALGPGHTRWLGRGWLAWRIVHSLRSLSSGAARRQ